jgi:hypothetical protein
VGTLHELPVHRLVKHMDTYIDAHNGSQDAYERANQVSKKFEWIVEMAVREAIHELPIPEELHTATIIQFPVRNA